MGHHCFFFSAQPFYQTDPKHVYLFSVKQRTYITREIVATDGGNRSSSVELSVTITNVKNQPPQWERESYTVVIPENTVRDTPIVVHMSGGGAGGRCVRAGDKV